MLFIAARAGGYWASGLKRLIFSTTAALAATPQIRLLIEAELTNIPGVVQHTKHCDAFFDDHVKQHIGR
jgi:hypothetical protein